MKFNNIHRIIYDLMGFISGTPVGIIDLLKKKSFNKNPSFILALKQQNLSES